MSENHQRPNHVLPSDPNTLLLDVIQRLTIIEQINSSIMGEQDEAKVSRRVMHKKLEGINEQIGQVKTDVSMVQTQIKQMAPVVNKHEQLRLQFTGGLYVAGFLWTIAILAAGFVLRQFWNWAWSIPAHHP